MVKVGFFVRIYFIIFLWLWVEFGVCRYVGIELRGSSFKDMFRRVWWESFIRVRVRLSLVGRG